MMMMKKKKKKEKPTINFIYTRASIKYVCIIASNSGPVLFNKTPCFAVNVARVPRLCVILCVIGFAVF